MGSDCWLLLGGGWWKYSGIILKTTEMYNLSGFYDGWIISQLNMEKLSTSNSTLPLIYWKNTTWEPPEGQVLCWVLETHGEQDLPCPRVKPWRVARPHSTEVGALSIVSGKHREFGVLRQSQYCPVAKEGFPEKLVCDPRNKEQRPSEKQESVPKEGFVWEKHHGGAERWPLSGEEPSYPNVPTMSF